MIIGQPTQTSKQAFKQRIKCENQGKSRKNCSSEEAHPWLYSGSFEEVAFLLVHWGLTAFSPCSKID